MAQHGMAWQGVCGTLLAHGAATRHEHTPVPASTFTFHKAGAACLAPLVVLMGWLAICCSGAAICNLPSLPRRQVLPGLAPLLDLMGQIAQRRGKTLSQVAINWAICQVRRG